MCSRSIDDEEPLMSTFTRCFDADKHADIVYIFTWSEACRNAVEPERFLTELRLRLQKCNCLHKAAEHMELSKLYHHFLGHRLMTGAERNESLLTNLRSNYNCITKEFILAVPGIRPLCEE